ncbi:MAG: endonuclease III [Candidatus Eisenbacteria bacterium]|jgi:endonuclease-3|nr:endonuclease III [Candidatus Eisenbacteria bacterium]
MNLTDLARHVAHVLDQRYPSAPLALRFSSPLELLVAVILSAQCTDERVNAVTPALFARFPAAADLADAEQEHLESLVRSTGFYRNKARLIRACCAELVSRFHGRVPDSLDHLVSLPGVGRKTANMVLGNAFSIPGVAVDTHVARVARRLGLTRSGVADDIERDLCELVPREGWVGFTNRMILFGRDVCRSRSPACASCPLDGPCPRIGVQTAGKSS